MPYNTRVMVANADMTHGSDFLRKGDQFVATEVDAAYLSKHKKADFVKSEPAPRGRRVASAPAQSTEASPTPATVSAAAPIASPAIDSAAPDAKE